MCHTLVYTRIYVIFVCIIVTGIEPNDLLSCEFRMEKNRFLQTRKSILCIYIYVYNFFSIPIMLLPCTYRMCGKPVRKTRPTEEVCIKIYV